MKVLWDTISGKQSQPGINKIVIIGEKATVENLQAQISKKIKEKEKQIQEERSVRPVDVPNIPAYQIEYLECIKFFDEMRKAHKLKDIKADKDKEIVRITGIPSSIDEVQKRMLEIVRSVSKSRCSENKKPLFLKVLKTQLGIESLKNELLNRRVRAVWTIESKTVYMYSDSNENARLAMDCLNDVIWEAQYPASRDFDDLERKLLTSSGWRNKKAELEKTAEPLQIVQFGDKPALSLVGLKYQKGLVLEEIPTFFELNVVRTDTFVGQGRRVSFLWRHHRRKVEDISGEFSVQINPGNQSEEMEIKGTRNAIANAKRALHMLHNTVKKGMHTVESPARVQHIKEDQDLLESVGLKTSCIVTIHEDEEEPMEFEAHVPTLRSSDGDRYTVSLSSGTTCTIKKGDITKLRCDAIVNAANGDMDHCGGLAEAIVRTGLFFGWLIVKIDLSYQLAFDTQVDC